MPTDPTILDRLRKATGPDRELDYDIWASADPVGVAETGRKECLLMPWSEWRELHINDRPTSTYGRPNNHQAYTGSIDAAVALLERVLPGWGWRGGTCCVSDDAFIFPDFNSPEHGERLRREFREDIDWSDLTDIDRRPPGNLPLALLESIFTALEAQQP